MNKNLKNTTNSAGNEKSLLEIFHIIYRRKWLIIISVASALCIAYIYSLMSTPIYESTVTLKKEKGSKNVLNSDFMEIVKMQTEDEVETEVEIIKTVDVLSKVVGELNLFFHFDKLETKSGNTVVLNTHAVEYTNPRFNSKDLPFDLPKIVSVKLNNNTDAAKHFITRTGDDSYSIYDAISTALIQTVKPQVINVKQNRDRNADNDSLYYDFESIQRFEQRSVIEFKTPLADLQLDWSGAPIGSKVYFSLIGFNNAVDGLFRQITVGKTGKTTLFTVSVASTSPYVSMLLANTVVDKFRDSRIEQQKQTIRYSFNFVDEQLQEMQLKLREAEDDLSKFKAGSQITTIDASSAEVVRFISSLEAERMNTELKLNEYKNKMEDMKKEMQRSGYFDQNFITSEGSGTYGDPFTSLMSQISDLELRKLELLQKRTENHPEVISLDEQINMAKQKLASYNQNTITAYQILINTLDKKRIDIKNMMGKYEGRLSMLPAQENTFARLLREKSVYEKMFTLLLDKREEMRMAELSKLQDIIIVDPGREPLKPVGPRRLFNFLIALLLGTFAGILAVFILELKNSKLVNLDEIEADFQIPILSILPKYTRAIVNKIEKATDPKENFVYMLDEESGFKETYSLLKTKIELQMQGKKKIFMITSCEENSGKSTIVGNLAVSFAMNSKRILIVDCDLRKAGLSRLFEVENEKEGLLDYLSKGTTPKLRTRVSKMIDILPTGGLTLDSSNLLSTERMESLFNTIDISIYDYIIVDTPPVTRVVDTLVLGKYIKDAMLVVRPDLSLKENVKGGLIDLSQARIKVRGIIVNAAEISKSYYYKNRYGYGYGYSYGGNGKSKSSVRKIEGQTTEKSNIKTLERLN
jgi:tyrosine-protein kinase Etk/Wzc